jgi:23S rRNA (cytosine1962-C5)-methyltransferase
MLKLMKSIRLKRGRERSVNLRHPWIFSGAIDRVDGDPQPGDTVDVSDHEGAWLAKGAYSPFSSIRTRIWTWDTDERIDEGFFERRIDAAVDVRSGLRDDPSVNAYREIFAESDGLPGLIVDRYVDLRVVQFLTAGAEFWRDAIISILAATGKCTGIYERSDSEMREKEGLPQRTRASFGDEPSAETIILENGLQFIVDVREGQKTGFYLDQRENRRVVRSLVRGKEVLDCFCYTGGFTVSALAGEAKRVVSVDSSESALALARRNVSLNGFSADDCEWIRGDVFAELRAFRDRGASFDVIILDPPRFAPTASTKERAARAYKDINLLAFKLLRQRGTLITFSCSGGVSPALFEKIVAGAAVDAAISAQIVKWLSQPEDHPVSLHFPEGRYLKGLVCRLA